MFHNPFNMSQGTAWKTQTFAQMNRKVEVKWEELFRKKTLQMEAWLKGLPEIGGRYNEIWSPRNVGLPFFFYWGTRHIPQN